MIFGSDIYLLFYVYSNLSSGFIYKNPMVLQLAAFFNSFVCCCFCDNLVLYLLQLQHDYTLGNYPVGRDDAAQLSALQILVEIGFVGSPESCTSVTVHILSNSII